MENNETKIRDKIRSLVSYEKYSKQGLLAYPELEYAILCYTFDSPNDDLVEKINDEIFKVSENSNLLWIICEIGKTLCNKETVDYSIHIPNYVKGYELFFYYRNFNSVILYGMKNGKMIKEIIIPGIK